MLFVKFYQGQAIRIENESIKVLKIDWETHPLTDSYVVVRIDRSDQERLEESGEVLTIPFRGEPLVLESYATVRLQNVYKLVNGRVQAQLAINSEVMLDIDFP
jgi:hypothetical protein